MITVECEMKLKDKVHIKHFVQKQNYEPFLKDLLIQTPMFSDKLELVTEQSCGEGDFFDPDENIFYEATLLVNSKIVSNIIKNTAYVTSEDFLKQRTTDLIEIFYERLESKKNKKMPLIIFNIFPDIFPKIRDSVTQLITSDKVDLIINELVAQNKGMLVEKNIFFVSYNADGNFYIREIYPRRFGVHHIGVYDRNTFPFEIIKSSISFG